MISYPFLLFGVISKSCVHFAVDLKDLLMKKTETETETSLG